jgi:hypothetical protein
MRMWKDIVHLYDMGATSVYTSGEFVIGVTSVVTKDIVLRIYS